MECPKCHEKIAFAAVIAEEQRLVVALEFDGPCLAAQTLGGLLTNTSELLIEIAKNAGAPMTVMVESITYGEGQLKIGLLLLALKQPVSAGG